MAEKLQGIGFALSISNETLNKLKEADKQINLIATHADNTATRVISAFKRMTDSVNPMINNVSTLNALLGKTVKSKGLSQIGKDMASGTSASTAFANAMTTATKAVNSLDISTVIKKMHGELKSLTEDLQVYGSFLNDTNIDSQRLAKEGIQEVSDRINRLKKAIPELEKLNKTFSQEGLFKEGLDNILGKDLQSQRSKKILDDMRKFYSQLEKESQKSVQNQIKLMEKQAKAQAKLESSLRKQNYASYTTSFEGSLRVADKADTYEKRAIAIKKLEQAVKKLSISESDYQTKVQKLTKAYNNLQKEQEKVDSGFRKINSTQRSMLNYSEQLLRRAALVFSVSQITGYVKKLASVRGEFELQNKALAAIMQNKDEADKLFGRITELAVKSPFQLKELVTYTKQLAAYRVENEKLYDTTKMLADVSAGLGVGMDRLILAYGQVKAANYLRGTELRQFSEAGINILGELSKYFTELEGRAISVGEVFERVSNRMVAFADVEEIFRRLTSKGGIFYNMQELQAETLTGMISNLKDSIDIMLNDIGTDTESSLKGAVSAVRTLVENWRELAYVIEISLKAIAPFISYALLAKAANSKFADSVSTLSKNIGFYTKSLFTAEKATAASLIKTQLLTKATLVLRTTLKGLITTLAALAPVAILAGVLEIIRRLTQASREAERLNKEINSIIVKDASMFNNSADGYKNLVEQLKDVNKNTQEYRDIIGKINANYSEYLGFIANETTSYDQLASSIDSVTEAMKRRAMMATQEKALQELEESYNKKREKTLSQISKDVVIGNVQRDLDTKEANAILDIIEKTVQESGRILKRPELNKILGDFFKERSFFDVYVGEMESYQKYILGYSKQQEDISKRISNAYDNQTYSTYESMKAFEELEAEKTKALEDARKNLEGEPILYKKTVDEINKEFAKRKIMLQVDLEGLDKETADYRISLLEWASATVKDVNAKLEEFGKGKDQSLLSGVLIDQQEAETGLGEILKSSIQQYEQQLSIIEAENNRKKVGTVYDQEAIDRATKLSELLYEKIRLLGGEEEIKKKIGQGDNNELTQVRKLINLLKEAQEAYDKLAEYEDAGVSAELVKDSYAQAFKDANIGDIGASMSFDMGGLIDALLKLMSRFGVEAQKEITKAIAGIKAEEELEIKIKNLNDTKKEMDKVFEDYQLSLDLKSVGLDENIMKDVFKIEATSLEELRQQVLSMRDEVIGTKGIETYTEYLQKLAEMENKALKERMKEYSKYLVKSKDERIRIEEEAIEEIVKLQAMDKFPSDLKPIVIEKIIEEKDKKIAELDWESLKETDVFRKSFEDLERVGTTTLEILLNKLNEFAQKSGKYLDTTTIKELMNNIKNLRDEVESRNPFKSLVEGFREYTEATKAFKQAQSEYEGNKATQSSAQQERDSAFNEYKKTTLSSDESVDAIFRLIVAENNLSVANENLEDSQNKVVDAQDRQSNATKKMEVSINDINSSLQNMDSIFNETIDTIQSLAEGFGLAFDDETTAVIDAFQQGFSAVIPIIASVTSAVIALTTASSTALAVMWPILVAGAALGAIIGSVYAVIAAHDAKRDKIIEAETKRIEKLQEEYEDLKETFEKSWNLEGLTEVQEQLEKNLEAQIASQKAAIEAMEDKKNKDKDEIEEAKEELAEFEKQLDKLREKQELTIELGGIGKDNYKDAAQTFVDAWVDAFLETGDGLDALNGEFDTFFNDMLKKQLLLRGTNKFLEPFFEEFDKMFQKDSPGEEMVTKEEIDNITDLWDDTSVGLNQFLKDLMASLGIVGGQGSGELSGLSKGIQSITEETAQALEALLNSMRAFSADNNQQLRNIHNILASADENVNPMLRELRQQTSLVSQIKSMLNSVIKFGHSEGGAGLKVFA